jgi:hypothetical protein
LANKYGLDPLSDQIILIQSQNDTYQAFITIDGWSKLINEHPQYAGMSLRDSTELKDGIPTWIECTIYRNDRILPIVIKEYYEEVIYADPEGYEVPLALTSEQQRYIDISKERIKKQQERLKNEQLTDEQKKEIEDYINELDVLIEDIEENPEGDYDDDAIEEMAASYADDQKDDIINVLKDWGYDDKWIVNNFINVDGMVEDIIQSDGYGFMSSYDGDYSTEHYDGEDYIIIRTN